MALLILLLVLANVSTAHEVPGDVTVHLILKPAGEWMQLLVRVPLRAIRDVDFPLRQSGYLDVEKLAPQLPGAATLWIGNFVEVHEGESRLPAPRVAATQLSIESDRSFASFEEALRQVPGPKLENSANVFWNQLLFDVLLEYPIRSDRSAFSIRPRLERLAARVVTVLRFQPPSGAERAYQYLGDPGLVPLDPRWSQAARRFVELGFFHILDGVDHLLFLLCLVIPFRRLRALVWVVTAFTVAHSITLIASAFDLAPDALWFPPLIETMIAASIVYMALENIVGARSMEHRWLITFAFGLVHGFGFSFALRETLQFAGSHLLTSLLSFNLGVELGQLLVLLLLVPALQALFRFVTAERMGTIILSALVAHTALHWLWERWQVFVRYQIEWPGIAASMRWMMWALIFGGLMWVLNRIGKGSLQPREPEMPQEKQGRG